VVYLWLDLGKLQSEAASWASTLMLLGALALFFYSPMLVFFGITLHRFLNAQPQGRR
jgi:hypothetical protein